MISFYPGPSRVYDEIPSYVKDAYKKGILSINHRSEEFMTISEKVITLLKDKLNVPKDYTVFYTTSATECWEIIAQSLTNKRSYHIYNGSFGEKWFEYTKRIASGVRSYPFNREEIVNPKKLRFGAEEGVICITQNETSNGTQVSNDIIRQIKENNPTHLIAVDATSSMGGVALDFKAADIWLASVQKCFGLPAGLGLLICSPSAIEKALAINERNHYNSLAFMNDMMAKLQTPFTPNVLNIYLLMRVLEEVKPIEEVHAKIVKRYERWANYFSKKETLQHLIRNEEARSFTVVPVIAKDEIVTKVKAKAKSRGILLGEGYGELKSSTFRIANFPAIKKKEIKTLQEFLSNYK
ncbi:aminotransferase class V-fold PLP-dependent enzyme [Chryseosolibacter indicus]|uniref:phosphoserine transaminase n=1 Tax=Chryseosolibacter indicus TaxID=2782351 RepID=A0ABS5VPM9_9BACT|nr:aminotransferase class V-fold PLP-dependent enzyme [Chryseosolibacter indicus]MBT1702809.1 aminotransferase class V-fold PLP-dependent enzyme [Chryseosolibacter indicus]